VAVIIANVIKTSAKPNFPLSGVIATIAKLPKTVNNAPSMSGIKLLIVNFHGRAGLTAN
jgi:hypothetical protein